MLEFEWVELDDRCHESGTFLLKGMALGSYKHLVTQDHPNHHWYCTVGKVYRYAASQGEAKTWIDEMAREWVKFLYDDILKFNLMSIFTSEPTTKVR